VLQLPVIAVKRETPLVRSERRVTKKRSGDDGKGSAQPPRAQEAVAPRTPTRVCARRGANVALIFCPRCFSYDVAEGKEDFRRLRCRACGWWWAPDRDVDEMREVPTCACGSALIN
jgi:hypothetical protein